MKTQKPKSISPLLGLLAMFGAVASGALPKLGSVTKSRKDRPERIGDYLKTRAIEKRKRRANLPHASAYARANG